jgi:hypothetical protein
MDNLIIAFDTIGEASLNIVDDESYDRLYEIYKNQGAGHDGYDKMIEEFWGVFTELDNEKNFQHIGLQWNSDDNLEKPITFKRILQLL